MIITDLFESHQPCPECGGPSFSDLILAEKKDACYYKVKASAKVWPSAYASGRLVQCRKKGAANYGNKSEGVAEGSLEEIDRRGFLKGLGAAAVAGAAGSAIAQSRPVDVSREFQNMRQDDPRVQHNKDIEEMARAIYEQIVATRGQPIDRRQQQMWMTIAREKATEKLSKYAPGRPAPQSQSLGFPSQGSERRVSRNIDNFESQGVAEGQQNSIVINGKQVDITSLEVDGVDPRDYPDFSDAYFSSGYFVDGIPLSDEELNQLADTHGDLLYDKAYDSLHEGWLKNTVAGVAIAGAALGANARVTPDGQGGFTGGLKPSATVTAPADNKPAAEAPKGFSKEYLQSVVDGKHPRPMVSVEKAKELLKNMQEGMAEGMERAVDNEGRTQAQWVQLVKSKFPGAKITQAKMIDGPMQATLPDGRKIAWSKVEQIDEIIDPSTALAKALRYIGRKFATAFPWLAVGGAGAGLAATGLMAPIVASMGGISTALSALSAEMAFTAGMAGTYAAPSIIQTIKDLFAADENSIQTGIKRWVEKYVGDDNDVQEFMLTHAKAAYEGKPGFRWRAKEWPVKLSHNEAEAFLEKNDKSWLDYEKQKKAEAEKAKIDAEKAKIDAEKAKIDAGKTDMDSAKEQGVAEDQVNEKSVSQAQFRTMAAAAHNPEFAKKVGIKQSVAKEFNRADKGSNYKKLPDRTTEGEIEKTKTGIVHHSSGAYGGGEAPRAPYDPGKYAKDIDHLDKNLTAKLDKSMGIKWPHGNKKSDMGEGEQQKGADYRDPPEADYGDDYQDMVSRVKKLAGLGPLKTVYDPARRVYRNVPTAVQPKK